MRVVYFNIETGDWLSEYDTIELLAHIGMVANILLIPPLTFLSKKRFHPYIAPQCIGNVSPK